MKKVVTIISVIIIIAAFSLTALAGCSNVSQLNKLEAPWLDYEQFTYTLSETVGETVTDIGTLVITVRRLNSQAVTLNEENFENITGSYCTYELNVTSGDNAGDNIRSDVLFKRDFTPIASYKVTDLSGTVNTSYIKYNTSKNKSTLTYNGTQSEFKQSASVYDNEMLYLLVRASDVKDSKYTMSFSITDNVEGGARSITVSQGSELTVNLPDYGKVECRSFTLSAAATYGDNVSLSLLLASSPISISNGETTTDIVKPIIKIIEGAYSYTLTDISITQE